MKQCTVGINKVMELQEDYQLRKDVDRLQYMVDMLEEYDKRMEAIEEMFEGYNERITDLEEGSNEDLIYKDLQLIEDYKRTSDDEYYLFRGDCWTINNNFESSAAITSETESDFTVTGTFRTNHDMVGIYWNSKDLIPHPYISYREYVDYRNVILEFDYSMTGCMDFMNGTISITIRMNDGSIYYLTMNRFIQNNHVTLDFNNLTLLAGNEYIDAKGEHKVVSKTTKLNVTNIKDIMLVLVPTVFRNTDTQYTVISNVDFTCEITNIEVTNGYICNEHIPLKSNDYRLCEGYDDFYNLNPKRVCKEMRKLGYTDWCDLYIGASHFYEKSGEIGDIIDVSDFNHTRTEKMVLDPQQPLNNAFSKWLDCYSKELLANDCPNLVVSVSMENLQCPHSWRQKTSTGDWAITGWVPSTFFYSPFNTEVVDYMCDVSAACLDIVVENELQPILQMGEAWWWWNENYKPTDDDGNPIDVEHWQPPCFYDDATKAAYLAEFGEPMPVYDTSWVTDFSSEMAEWLNQGLVTYSDALRSVVKQEKYDNGLYMALFFPPSVMDTERVPPLMTAVNYIRDAYSPQKLDILQIEDYYWVIWDSPHHKEAYTIGQELGFTVDKLHYFGGFVQYEEDAIEYWRLIKEAMEEAKEKDFAEVYVWAGSQVRRDWKMFGYDIYEIIQQLLF